MSTPAVLTITELCPDCNGCGVLVQREGTPTVYAVVCEDCRTYLHAETPSIVLAVEAWNTNAREDLSGHWPKWQALLPNEDERDTVIADPEAKGCEPDLSNYKAYEHIKPIPIDNTKTAPVAQSVEKQ